MASSILLVILFHLLLVTGPSRFAAARTEAKQTGFRVALTRAGSDKSLASNQYFSHPLSRAKKNVKHSLGSPVKSRLSMHKNEYVMKISIGTPPVQFSAVMDTGSDLIWTCCHHGQDHPNKSVCPSNLSGSLSSCDVIPLGCNCRQEYKDGSTADVTMVNETLTLGDLKIPNVRFGHGYSKNSMSDGVVGMGRGHLSLVSQLKLKERVFSYCLASSPDQSKTGVLLTGSEASSALTTVAKIQSIPLLKNSVNDYESYYYVPLEGITVGNTKLAVTRSDFAIKKDGSGGMIIDSGTLLTYLGRRVLDMTIDAFVSQTKLKRASGLEGWGLDLCFESPDDIKAIPQLVFHFEGVDWELPRENYMYKESGRACLAMKSDDGMSVLGNMNQQNTMMVYDLEKERLSFTPANCNEL